MTPYELGLQEQREEDARKARALVEDTLAKQGHRYRLHGPEVMLAAAQVYATLAAR